MKVTWMVRKDTDDVLSFTTYSQENLEKIMKKRDVIGKVCSVNDRVVGCVIYKMKQRHLHIISLDVDPAYRRRGVGTKLMEDLQKKIAIGSRWQSITCNVPDNNLSAHLFLRKCGWKAVKVDVDHYKFLYKIEEPAPF